MTTSDVTTRSTFLFFPCFSTSFPLLSSRPFLLPLSLLLPASLFLFSLSFPARSAPPLSIACLPSPLLPLSFHDSPSSSSLLPPFFSPLLIPLLTALRIRAPTVLLSSLFLFALLHPLSVHMRVSCNACALLFLKRFFFSFFLCICILFLTHVPASCACNHIQLAEHFDCN